jgi:hypothetical protein
MQTSIKLPTPTTELSTQKSIKVENWQPISREFFTKRKAVLTHREIETVTQRTQPMEETLESIQ